MTNGRKKIRKKDSPRKEPNTLQSIKSMHVNQRKYELDRIEKENLKIA